MPAETLTASASFFGGAIPVFRVESVRAAVNYYLGVLGFKLDWDYEGFSPPTHGISATSSAWIG